MPPYENRVKESRTRGVHRILLYLTVLPLLAIAGALFMNLASDSLSQGNKEIRLYGMVMEQEINSQDRLSPELEAFYGQGGTIESLREKAERTAKDFKLYGTIVGALIGLVVGLSLIGLSVKRTRRTYEINGTACVSCARCFSYCPQNQKDKKQDI